MREGAVACSPPGIVALADRSRVLTAEGQVVEELPEVTQGVHIILKSPVGHTCKERRTRWARVLASRKTPPRILLPSWVGHARDSSVFTSAARSAATLHFLWD